MLLELILLAVLGDGLYVFFTFLSVDPFYQNNRPLHTKYGEVHIKKEKEEMANQKMKGVVLAFVKFRCRVSNFIVQCFLNNEYKHVKSFFLA